MPAIQTNDNRVPAGTLTKGVLHLTLDARTGLWQPDGPNREVLVVQAFGQPGRALQAPAPLIRVPAGTLVDATVRNLLPGKTLAMHGLQDRPANTDDSFELAYGAQRTVRFRLSRPGTYFYWATTTGQSLGVREGADAQLSGAIVVDPPNYKFNANNDRVFVITDWDDVHDAKGKMALIYQQEFINGRSFPATERLSYERGTNVVWHLVNISYEDHPLHLHGFFFDVLARGNGLTDRAYASADRDREVTELSQSGTTSTLAWTASRTGNWMLHCHLAYHIMAHTPLNLPPTDKPTFERYEHSGKMGGMIVLLTIAPRPGDPPVKDPAVARSLKLIVERAPEDKPHAPAFAYVEEENGTTTAGTGALGPPLFLTQNQTVGIDVVNKLDEPTAVHWHGIELADSYYDGVPNASGYGNRLEPMIMPGESFTAVITPPRAGTFIYHTHMDDVWQLRAGLSGPLIVLPPGATFDPATDHIVQITTPRNPADLFWLFVNGSRTPAALTMTAGVPNRLRFINITTFGADVLTSLVSVSGPAQWVPIALDGADLPANQRVPESAVQTVTIGETRDFSFKPPAPGDYRLLFYGYPGDQVRATLPIHVVAPAVSSTTSVP
jgi:FtsP/CotA-like multicopper oxidase with cupredoxin domain